MMTEPTNQVGLTSRESRRARFEFAGAALVAVFTLTFLSAWIELGRSNADQRATRRRLNALRERLAEYHAREGFYPAELGAAASLGAREDGWGQEVTYEVTTGGFLLRSHGRDGQPGGSGWNADHVARPDRVLVPRMTFGQFLRSRGLAICPTAGIAATFAAILSFFAAKFSHRDLFGTAKVCALITLATIAICVVLLLAHRSS